MRADQPITGPGPVDGVADHIVHGVRAPVAAGGRLDPGRARDDGGLALLMTAGAMVALLVVAALVVDIGYAKQMRREAQASADAAALAAAQVMASGGSHVAAATAARDIADTNLAALDESLWPGCSDPARPPEYEVVSSTRPVTGDCVSFDRVANLVRVALPTVESPSFFGKVVDRDRYDVTARASAVWEPDAAGGAGPCGLCVIDGGTLQFSGGVTVKVDQPGTIYGSRLTTNATDSSNIEPTPIGYTDANNSNWRRNQPGFSGLYQQVPAVVDPYSVTMDYSGVRVDQSNVNSCADFTNKVKPDVMFTQSVSITGCNLTLAPGTYYFAGTLNVTRSTVYGNGVTVVLGCANGSRTAPAACGGREGGNFNFDGGSTFLTAPTSGPYANFGILYDPGNTAGTPSKVTNNGTLTVNGNVYAKRAGITLSNGTFNAWSIVVGAKAFDFNGGSMHITSQGGTSGGSGGGRVGLWR